MIQRTVLALAAGLATSLAAATALAQAPVEPRFNQVDLQAEVSREVQNDLMTATLVAEANDPSAAQVATQLNRITADALKIAAEFKTVKTRSGFTNTFPVYDRAGKLTGWRGRSEVRLESKDVQAMSILIGRLQSSMQLGGVAFTVSPEVRRQVQNELLTEAVAAFRDRADIATKALGGRSYKIRRVSLNTGGFVPGPRPMMAERAMAASASSVPPPTFEGGTSMVQVNANGTVEVE
jgi:predicted secreted protein